jgi:hypothetical protein
LAPQTRQWTALAPVPDATTTTLGVFAWQHRVAAILQQRFETNWFGPRALKLVLCHPDDPEGTRQVWDLGRWQTVNYVRQHAGALWIGGSYFAPGDGGFPSGKVLLADLAATRPRLQRLTGDAHTQLASAPLLTGANHGACLAAGGINRVFLIPTPAGGTPLEAEPPQPPRIAPRLANAEVAAGGAHAFAPQIHGSAPMSCQWLKDGVAIAGATTPRLALAAASATDAGLYSLIVSNAAGQVTNAATLTVLAADNLRIARHPANVARLLGQSATLQVEVESAGQPGFQWFHDGQPVTGAIQAQLTLPKLEWADAGEYFAEARLGTAVMRSQAARLTLIKPGAPLLLGTPSNRQPVGLGAEATLASAATGWGELAWQWFKDGQPVSGGTGAELNLGLGSPEDLGEYRLEVRDTTGGVTTHTFTVVLAAAGTLTVQRAATGELQAILSGGVPGQICVLQSSSNLEEWKAVETRPVPTTGTLEFPLPATVAGGVFFRIKVTP